MCGGIISESLVQTLATEGIKLPPSVIQRGIEGYTLHLDVGSLRIRTTLEEKRIGAVYRGAGPKGTKNSKWESFDAFLQRLAVRQIQKIRPLRCAILRMVAREQNRKKPPPDEHGLTGYVHRKCSLQRNPSARFPSLFLGRTDLEFDSRNLAPD